MVETVKDGVVMFYAKGYLMDYGCQFRFGGAG
jgi:hypothetical protein